MTEKIPCYLKGYVKIRLESPMPERFLALCVHNRIPLWNLNNHGLYYEMELLLPDFFRLPPFRRKTSSRIFLLERHGLPFLLKKGRKKKALLAGILICGIFLYGCSLFLWDIQVEGNLRHSQETILRVLDEDGVRAGILKSSLDCSGIAARVREAFPDVVWVSATLEGTCLNIELRENQEGNETSDQEPDAAWDLTADRDGTVLSIVTRRGTPLVQAGQKVKKGDVLVTGALEILNNDQLVQRYEYVGADADILLEVDYQYYDEFSMTQVRRQYEGSAKSYFFLRLFGQEFSMAGKAKETEEEVRWEKPVYLTDSFCLPISYGTITRQVCRDVTVHYDEEEARDIARDHLTRFMKNLVEEGAEVTGRQVEVQVGNTQCISKGTVTVIRSCVQKTPVSVRQLPQDGTGEPSES